jgi:glycosyltransferase involved in cell wall biosynthesis
LVTISIIVTSYNLDRLEDICDLISSVRNQLKKNYELIYVTEGDIQLHEVISNKVDDLGCVVKVIQNDVSPGLSESRNLGSNAASGEILAFVDDDVVLDADWTETVEETFRIRIDATGITGPAYPLWTGAPAEWLPKEFDWLIGSTRWFDANTMVEVSNCWGMNMAFRRADFLRAGGFSTESTETSRYSGQGPVSNSNIRLRHQHAEMAEDVDLSIRIRNATAGKLYYVPSMRVYSKVHSYRFSDRYVIQRSSWIGHTRRNVNRNRENMGSRSLRIETKLILRVFAALAGVGQHGRINLNDIRKKYRILLLSLAALTIGYVAGPLQ